MKPSNTNTQEVERDIQGAATSEQAADLAALQAAANDNAPGAPGAAPVAEAAPHVPDLAEEIAGLVTVAVATLGPMFSSLKGIYTPEVTQAAAQAIARVCQKHGWLQNGMMGRYGEEIACIAIVGPLALQTYKGVMADLEARKPKQAERIAPPAPTEATPTEGQKTVTFGDPVEAAA